MPSTRKKQRLSTPTTEQQLPLSNIHSENQSKDKARDDSGQCSYEKLAYEYSNMEGDMTRIKQYASKLALLDQSIVNLNSDGSILTTPPPPPPPQPSPQPFPNDIITPPRQFPNEILSLILNHLYDKEWSLYEYALVNKQFHSIANPLVWKLLGSDEEDYHAPFIAIIRCASRQHLKTIGRYITDLYLRDVVWSDTLLTRLLPHTPHLKKLTYEPAHEISKNITKTTFENLPFYCQHLTYLEIDDTSSTRRAFSAIGQYCHQLRELYWTVVKSRSPKWLKFLTSSCPLEELSLFGEYNTSLTEKHITIIKKFDLLTSLSIHRFPSTNMTSLLLPSPTDFDQATSTTHTTTVPDAMIHLPRLQQLRLSAFDVPIDEIAFIGFIKTHPHLDIIRLDCTDELTDISLAVIAEWLPNLRCIALHDNKHFTPQGIRRFIQHYPSQQLESIAFYSCHHGLVEAFSERDGVDYVSLNRIEIKKIKQQHMEMTTTTTTTTTSPSPSPFGRSGPY